MTQLFSDNFESGGFSAWTSTSSGAGAEKPVVTTNRPHYGVYNMQYAVTGGSWSKATKTLPSSSMVYARLYFSLDTLPASGRQATIMVLSGTASIAKVYAANNSGTMAWKLSLRENGVYQSYLAATGPNINTYYCLELYVKIDSSAGEAALYVNGSLAASTSGKKTDNNGNIIAFDAGEYDGYGGANTITVSIDDVSVADTYVGPENAAQSVADSAGLADSALTDKLFVVNDGLQLAEACLVGKSLLVVGGGVFLAETVEAGRVRRSRLFLVLGDLAIEISKD